MQFKDTVKSKKYHLMLIIGRPGSGKSKFLHNYSKQNGIPVINLDDILGKKIPEGKTNQYVYGFLDGFLKTYKFDEILIDKKNIIYDKSSNIDLLKFFEILAKDKTVITTWTGYTKDGKLYHLNKNQEVDYEYDLSDLDFSYMELL